MGSFYGNIITHIPRTNFQISHTYPNAWMLKQQSIVDTDNVALYNYVLVDYNHPNTSYTDKETIGLYQFNNLQDQNAYGSEKLIINYDQTVWQKVLNAEGIPYYKTICRINSILPSYPAQTHFQPKSLIEFQRLNNAPIIKEYTPISTEEFGITNYEIDSIKLDKNAVEFFNKRNSEVAGENIEVFEITMDETHPSMSVYTTHEYEEQIKTKIEELNESINELNQKLKDTQDNIATHTTSINNESDNIINEEKNITDSLQDIADLEEDIMDEKDNILSIISQDIEEINKTFNNKLSEQLTANNNTLSSYVSTQKSYLTNIQNKISNIYNQIKGNSAENLLDISNYPEDTLNLIKALDGAYINIITNLNNKIMNANNILEDSTGFTSYTSAIQNNITIMLTDIGNMYSSLSSLSNTFNEIEANHIIAYENGLVASSAYTEMELAIEKLGQGDITDQEFINEINRISSEILQNGEVCNSLVESLRNNNSYLTEESTNNIKTIISGIQETLQTGDTSVRQRCQLIKTMVNNLSEVKNQLQNELIEEEEFKQDISQIELNLNMISGRLINILTSITEINEIFESVDINKIIDIQNDNNNNIQTLIQNLQTDISAKNNKINEYCEKIFKLNNTLIEKRNQIQKSNENIENARKNIFGDMLGIQRQNTTNMLTIPILNTTYDNLVYYTELLTWYTEVFLPSTQTLTIEDIPYRLRYFDTDTLEYPTK